MSQRPRRTEPTGINPRVDCVFKAVLGDPDHPERLLDFLNGVLQRSPPIVAVTIVDPHRPPDFIGDKHTILDVKATLENGDTFQVEMQSWNQTALKERMLYDWADLFEAQIDDETGYALLRPVTSIWVLNQNTFRNAPSFHHRFGIWDRENRVCLSEHFELHVLELAKWRRRPDPGASPAVVRCMRFFAEAENWVEVPTEIDHPILESAMSVLHTFQENSVWNDVYRQRRVAERSLFDLEAAAKEAQAMADTAIAEKEEAIAEKQEAIAEKEEALAMAQSAVAEKEALLAKLRARGIDLDPH